MKQMLPLQGDIAASIRWQTQTVAKLIAGISSE